MDLRSAVEAGWEHQLALLQALVRAPSTLGNERAAQELVADELRRSGSSRELWDVEPGAPGSSPPLIDYTAPPERDRDPAGSGGGRSLTFNGHIDVVPAGAGAPLVLRPVGRRDRGAGACTAAARRT